MHIKFYTIGRKDDIMEEVSESKETGYLLEDMINPGYFNGTATVCFRIGRSDGLWASTPIERVLTIVLPYYQDCLEKKQLDEIDKYAIMLATSEQAIIRCEFDDGREHVIHTPTKWRKNGRK